MQLLLKGTLVTVIWNGEFDSTVRILCHHATQLVHLVPQAPSGKGCKWPSFLRSTAGGWLWANFTPQCFWLGARSDRKITHGSQQNDRSKANNEMALLASIAACDFSKFAGSLLFPSVFCASLTPISLVPFLRSKPSFGEVLQPCWIRCPLFSLFHHVRLPWVKVKRRHFLQALGMAKATCWGGGRGTKTQDNSARALSDRNCLKKSNSETLEHLHVSSNCAAETQGNLVIQLGSSPCTPAPRNDAPRMTPQKVYYSHPHNACS